MQNDQEGCPEAKVEEVAETRTRTHSPPSIGYILGVSIGPSQPCRVVGLFENRADAGRAGDGPDRERRSGWATT